MAQSPKFPGLGNTKIIRIPESCVTHVLSLCDSYDRLCVTHGFERVTELQEKIEQGIDSYLERI